MMKLVFETEQNFSAFLAARLIFVTVLLGAAALYRPAETSWGALAWLFVANAALSVGCAELHRRGRFQGASRWIALTGAVIVDTLVLRAAGGSEIDFAYLYLFTVGAAGLLVGISGSLWTAVLSTLAIAWLMSNGLSSFGTVEWLRVAGFAMALTVVGLFTSYVHDRLLQKERTHRATLGELEQTRLDTQAILDSLGTGLIVLNRQAEVMYSNPVGRTILGLTEESSSDDLMQIFRGHIHSQETPSRYSEPSDRMELIVETRSGPKPVGFAISLLKDRKAAPRGHIIIFSDLSKVKEAERRERERDRLAAVGMLSSDLAHEIRNPLATVRGCTEMISVSGPVSVEQMKYLSLALSESDRLNKLLADFLTFAQLKNPQRRAGDLHDLIHTRIDMTRATIAVVDRLRGGYETEFDEEQMSLAVDLILLTLSEWADGTGELRVESDSNSAGTVRFRLPELQLPKERLNEVFKPFSSAPRTAHGLALPTAARVVHAHGGQLRAASSAEMGTYFEMSF